jgi:hypothetical protein
MFRIQGNKGPLAEGPALTEPELGKALTDRSQELDVIENTTDKPPWRDLPKRLHRRVLGTLDDESR